MTIRLISVRDIMHAVIEQQDTNNELEQLKNG